jgi:hypothetical protein
MLNKYLGATVAFLAMMIVSCGVTSPIRPSVFVEYTGEVLSGGVRRCSYMESPGMPPLFGKDNRMRVTTEVDTFTMCPASLSVDGHTGEPF